MKPKGQPEKRNGGPPMTREEAIKAFEEIKDNAQNNLGKKYAAGCDGYYRDKIELAEAALKALYAYKEDEIEKH